MANGYRVLVPNGTFVHTGLIHVDSVTLYGNGSTSILKATGADTQAVYLEGNGGTIMDLTLDSTAAVRGETGDHAKISVWEATNFKVSNVTILKSKTAGILVFDSSHGLIQGNALSGTLADGIHMTQGSHNVRVRFNTVRTAGDDSIAVVSYGGGELITRDIEIANNWVYDNVDGRSLSVVGGKDVKIVNNLVDTNDAGRAGIYIAAEGNDDTLGVEGVLVQGNTILHTGEFGDHASILVFLDPLSPHDIEDVVIIGNKGCAIYSWRHRRRLFC